MFSVTRTPLELREDIRHQHVWRLSATVTAQDTDMTSSLFVYHVLPEGGEIGEIFEAVASVPQLSEIGLEPVNAGEEQVPYYRKDTLVFDCRSAEQAEDLWTKIQEDIHDLVDNLKAADALSQEVTEVFS